MSDHRDPAPGDLVELFTRFNDSWVAGFEIASLDVNGYQVRRTSDGELLPVITSPTDLRVSQRRVL